MARLATTYYDYDRFRNNIPILTIKDLKVGIIYHIPPTIIYGRRDFICENVNSLFATGRAYDYEKDEWDNLTLYASELLMRYIVEKQEINKH